MSVDPSQFGLMSQGVDPVPPYSIQPGQPAPQIQPQQQPQQSGPTSFSSMDPMAQLTADLSAVLRPQQAPTYKPPDTSGLDTQIAQEKGIAQQSETALEAAEADKAGLVGQMMQGQQSYDQQVEQLFQKYPTEQVAYGTAMHVAPQIAILATLGGKAAGLSGQAMLGALTGMMTGLNQGAADQFQQSLEKWKQELQKVKDRHQEQMELYKVMLDAYQGRADAAQKARDFALTMTHDAIDQKEYQVKDSIDLFKARTQAITSVEKAQLMLDRIALQVSQSGQGQSPAVRQLDAALTADGVQIPGAGRGGQLYWQKLSDLVASNPDKSPQQLAEMAKSGALGMQAAKTETTTAARKEASIGAAQEALNSPGGLWDQVNAAAKKIDFGDAKFKNNLELAIQGKAVANKDIQRYVSTIMEARAELAQVFARNGQTTDAARRMAEEAIPLAASYEELQAAEQASKQGAQAVRAGNQAYMQQIQSGQTGGGAGPRTVTRTGYSASTGQKFVQYSDGTIEPVAQ
jgi:hypothetical protein